MNFGGFIITLIIAFAVGVFGFSQIIGSLQNLHSRPGLLGTMILWTVILCAGAFFVVSNFPEEKLAMIIGYAASFVTVLGQGKVE